MSLYEALSLVVSSVSTLGTVFIGLRQLRQAAPARAAAPVPGYAGPAGGYAAPGTAYPGSGPAYPQPPGPAPAARRTRPSTVRAASLMLFIAAAAHPFAVALYYTIRFATDAGSTAAELADEGIVDVLVFGGVAFGTALLGVFVARGSRVAVRLVWAFGIVAVLTLSALVVLVPLALLAPEAERPTGFDLFFVGYFGFALIAYTVSALLLVAPGSRAFFRRT